MPGQNGCRRAGYKNLEDRKMGMFNPKNKKIIAAIIAIICVVAMVVPTIISILV
jgi:hypothetical protein